MAARELYASARYDEALAVLDGLRPADSGNPTDRKSIEQYRSLCLLALGRGSEAEAAIAAVIAADPMYAPTETEASPRVRAAFAEVRQRKLPEIARDRYALARAAFDNKAYAEAAQRFREVLRLIDDPDMRGRMSDLRVLAEGFVDLSVAAVAAAAPPPEPKREAPAPPGPAPAALPEQVFDADDAGVTLPVVVKQDVPRVPSQIIGQTRDRGILELLIDEQGRVTRVNLRLTIHPMYDALLMSAARDWRYQPATYQGHPVKFRKVMQITVTRR